MNRLILCGPPGSGKTTVGRLIAKKLDALFMDLDDLIEKRYAEIYGNNMKCREIYAEKGSDFFRSFEKEIILGLRQQNYDHAIIATGGGVIEVEDSVKALRDFGKIIYLQSIPSELYPRVIRNGIPAYLDPKDPFKSFEKLMQKRGELYKKAAAAIISVTNKTPEQVADEVIEQMRRYGG